MDETKTRPKSCQGRYPTWITIVGYAMKKRRFEELHGKAIRWPEGKLEYIGIDGDQKHVMDEAKKGEVRSRIYTWAKMTLTNASSSLTPIFRTRKTHTGVTRHWLLSGSPATHSSGFTLIGLLPKS